MAELRPYQSELLQRVFRTLVTESDKRVMMQLPTGGGKTVIAGALLAEWLKANRRAVWLTHRRELVEQTCEMLNKAGVRAINPSWPPRTIAWARRGATVILMAQTAGRRASQMNIWTGYDANDLMIIDEAHHASADGYVRAMRQWPGMVLGMTATPWRLSEKEGFDHLFNDLVCGPQNEELQSMGALCRARVLVPSAEQRIDGGQPGPAGDYTEAGIDKANEGPRRVMTAEAVKIWQEYAADRQTIAYAVSQKHACNLQKVFKKAGVEAKVILSKTESEQRAAAIDGLKQGAVKVLINVLVATEGFDLPNADCVMMARPTKSLALYLQMVGRGLRPKPYGRDCLILDLAGNTLEHGLPEARRRWSLAPRGKQPDGELPVDDDTVREMGGKTCGRCGRLRGAGRWKYEHHCGNIHDLVCDLCHIDAHIAAHLPADPPLDKLVETDSQSAELARIDDRAALVELYHATDGPNWKQNDNWLTDAPLEEWYGVNVDAGGRVRELHLVGNQLSGVIPRSLGRVTGLTELSLIGNSLTGEIPWELGRLTNLIKLKLAFNELDGEIPWELGRLANLTELDLDDNSLDGEIPWELGHLANLTDLALSRNMLTGEIPSRLGDLTDLQFLGLGDNMLTGEIPWELGRLANLRDLYLAGNRLTGEIPVELCHLNNLESIYLKGHGQYLGFGQFTGCIPKELRDIEENDLDELGLPFC